MPRRDSPAFGNGGKIAQLLERLHNTLFQALILVRRLQRRFAAPDQSAAAGPQPATVVPDAAARSRLKGCIYEEAIAAVLHEPGYQLHFQPLYEAVQSRGHRSSKKTIRRYLKKMERAGRIYHDDSGYRLVVNPPPSGPVLHSE